METDFGKDRLWAILSLKLDSVATQMVDTIWRYLVIWNRGQLEWSNCGICQDKVNTPRGPVIILKMQHWYTVGCCLGMRCRIPTLQMREVRCQWKWQMQWYLCLCALISMNGFGTANVTPLPCIVMQRTCLCAWGCKVKSYASTSAGYSRVPEQCKILILMIALSTFSVM